MERTKEQIDAIEKSGTNILVSAGAGSGKTTVLTDRVLEKIKHGIHVNELLILTFTEAAAKEMKDRIRSKIEEAKLEEEKELLDMAYITTFDSFCLSIVKKYAYLKNISPNPKILDNAVAEVLKLKYIREILDAYYQKKDPQFLTMISSFCGKDDTRIEKTIRTLYDKTKQLLNKEEYFANYMDHFYGESFKKVLEEEYENNITSKISSIQEGVKELSQYVDGSFIEELEEALEPIYRHQFSQLIDKLPSLPRGSMEYAKEVKKEISALVSSIKTFTSIPFLLKYEEYLESKDTVSIILQILQQLDEKLSHFKEKHEHYEYIDIELLAISILQENKDIREHLKKSFHEIMIDEYQDTNDLQEYFISMIANNNVYMVGDIKQAIYGFRNANPNLFKEKYEAYKKNIGGIKIDLNKNFRSREEVIEDINKIFDILLTEEFGGANYQLEHRMKAENKLYQTYPSKNAHLEIYPAENEIEEASIIVSDIQKKIKEHYQVIDKETKKPRDVKYADFTILFDRTTSLEAYISTFEEYGIPLHIMRDETMMEDHLFLLLKQLFLALFQEDNAFDYVSIARSFVIEEEDHTIYEELKNQTYTNTEVIHLLEKIKQDIQNKTASQLFETIIKEFKVEENLYKIGELDTCEVVIKALQDFLFGLENLGYSPREVASLLEELTAHDLDIKIKATPLDDNKVLLTNIHKSKGLEYPICYYARLKKNFNQDDLKELFYFDRKLGFIVPIHKEGMKDTIVKELFKNHYYEEEMGEKIRLLYVALTRAKEKMIFVMPPFAFKKNSFERIKHKNFYDFYSYMQRILEPFIQEAIILPKEKKPENRKKKIVPIEVEELMIEPICKEKINFSKQMHELLPEETKKSIAFGLEIHARLEGANFKEEPTDFYSKRLFHQPLLKNRKEAIIYQEYEFIEGKKRGTIDLMLEYHDHIDIIDYKLKNIDDLHYQEQLLGYRHYMQSIQSKPVFIYLYSILEDRMEEVK